MDAKNMNQLNAMLMRELRKAMSITSEKVLADMHEGTGKFYTQGNPKMYKRTGALGDTPQTTQLSVIPEPNGGSAFFDAYLDTSYSYTTGSNPNMSQVLGLANDGKKFTTKNGYPARDTLGKRGFWQESEKKMEKTMNDTLMRFFR